MTDRTETVLAANLRVGDRPRMADDTFAEVIDLRAAGNGLSHVAVFLEGREGPIVIPVSTPIHIAPTDRGSELT